jgi:hypothetical protein
MLEKPERATENEKNRYLCLHMIFSLRHIQSIDLLREILVFSMVKIYSSFVSEQTNVCECHKHTYLLYLFHLKCQVFYICVEYLTRYVYLHH